MTGAGEAAEDGAPIRATDRTKIEPESSGSSTSAAVEVVVAGHICLDIIPQLESNQRRPEDIFQPGGLVNVGPATLALGGCVANTGIALHRLGAKTRLVGKVGDDLLGKAIRESLREQGDSLPDSMVVSPGEATSYTIVLSPPGVDRGFLHCSGANDSFAAADLHESCWQNVRILHFGYPPLMRTIAADAGRGLAERFAAARRAGLLVTLDMAMPAAGSRAGVMNWQPWLENVLPQVDVFLPSYDELEILLAGPASPDSQSVGPCSDRLAQLSDKLLTLGAPIVVIKLGNQGLYLRTGDLRLLFERAAWNSFDWSTWQNRELLAPCFEVDVVGTTGSGDCTIAGFLMSLLQGADPEDALRFATAVGAHCVESADATSGIPACSQVEARMKSSWPQRRLDLSCPGWQFRSERGVYVAPHDKSLTSKTNS